MSLVGAFLLLFGGALAAAATWNAARPVGDPTRRYSPWWLPAMVVTELSPLFLLVTFAVGAAGWALGGTSNPGGAVGATLLGVAALLLVRLRVRSVRAARRLRASITGPVHRARGAARLLGRPVTTPAGVVEEHGIAFADGCTLDLIAPAVLPGSVPVLVYVHGGGWTNGDPQRQARDLYGALARAGWVVAAIRYPFTPTVTVEDQVDTVRAALRWARAAVPERGAGVRALVVAGGSAGGHLAAMAALTPHAEAERVDACVGIYGVYDMANRHRTRAHWTKVPAVVMRATVDAAPERYRALSPIDRVGPGSPPILLVHGTRDTLVPVGEARLFARVLREADRPVELVEVDGAEHAFDALSSITSRTVAALIRDRLAATLSL